MLKMLLDFFYFGCSFVVRIFKYMYNGVEVIVKEQGELFHK